MPSSHTLGAVGHMSSSSTSSLTGFNSSSGTNLIINYLPQDMNDRELFSLFRTMGPIDTCRIMRDFKVSSLQILFKHSNIQTFRSKETQTHSTPLHSHTTDSQHDSFECGASKVIDHKIVTYLIILLSAR